MRGTLPRLQSCPSAPRSPHSSSAQTTPPRTWRCTDTDHMRQPEADAQPLPLPLPLNTLQAPVLHDAPVRAGAGGSLRPSSDDLRAAGGDASTKQASERESEASSARTRSAAPASPSPGRSRPGTSTTRPARRPRRGTAAAPWGFRSGPAQRQISGNRFSSAVRSGFRADGLVARFQRYFLTRTEAAGSHLPWSLRLRLRLRLRFDFRLLRHAAERRQVLRLYSDREHRTCDGSGGECCPCCSACPPSADLLEASSSF